MGRKAKIPSAKPIWNGFLLVTCHASEGNLRGGGFCRCEGTEQLRNILSVGLQLYLDLLQMPDIPYILLDRTVGRELAGRSRI